MIKSIIVLIATLMLSQNVYSNSKLRGKIKIDGSSTVFPITEAIAEEFNKTFPRVKVNVGVSGTGGGFKKFCVGETDINDASRPIKDKEIKKAKSNGIKYIKLPVAFDGITVVINKQNTWAKSMTSKELKKLWDRGSKIKMWSDLRKSWPKREIKLYGPGTDSGTFDYFTEAINGKSGRCRSDFTKSEDDNVLVTGVAGNKDALGFFGFAYYKENKDKISAVSISHKGKKKVMPSMKTINNGTYQPLSRPIFIYVNTKSLSKKNDLQEFVKFYLTNASDIVGQVGYVSLPKKDYKKSLKQIQKIIK